MLEALPFILSPLAFLLMGISGIPLIQYFTGQRRDLYFLPRQRLWLFWQTAGWLMVGSLALVCRLSQFQQVNSACCPGLGVYFIGLVGMWMFLPGTALHWQPYWVAQFEAEHTPEEIELFITNGTRLLQRYPQSFRRVIRHPVGWDLWLLTTVRTVRARESSRQRAK